MSHAPPKKQPPGDMLAYLPGAASLAAYGESRDRSECFAFRTSRQGSEATEGESRDSEECYAFRTGRQGWEIGDLLYACLVAPVIP